MDKNITILCVEYLEPYGQQVIELAKQTGYDTVIVNRNPEGIGSLAEVINRGVKYIETEWVFITTNATFPKNIITRLIKSADESTAAVHPCFHSDHEHMRPKKHPLHSDVPFIEFTCPLVRTKILKAHPLDESMPYWGHDLDWGYRVRSAGYNIRVNYSVEVNHIYIRDQLKGAEITKERWQKRKETDASTRAALVKKYGPHWKTKLFFHE